MPFYLWSETANSNGSADPTINMVEGMAPSGLNDGVRAAMARLREWGNDIAGAIVTGGTSTAYTVSSNQVFDTLDHLDGQVIAFTPHTTNGNTVTLSVDSLVAKPLRTAPSQELQAGTIIQGTPYIAVYNNTDGAFYLQGFYGNPYSIPLAGGMDYWGSTAPNSSFVFPVGQAISRTTYSALFALVGTTYGSGDGSTTFNLPDKRGRVSACMDNMGGSDAIRFADGNSSMAIKRNTLGGAGGSVTHTLATSEIPPVPFSGTTGNDAPDHSHSYNAPANQGLQNGTGGTGILSGQQGSNSGGANTRHQHPFSGNISGGGASHENCQPTILCNYIMRII
jgi:microcystin-dependent protein